MPYVYAHPLKSSEAFVLVAIADPERRCELPDRLAIQADRYGFSVACVAFQPGATPVPPQGSHHSLAILVMDRPLDSSHETLLSSFLMRFSQVSVALAYPSGAEMLASRPAIERMKTGFGDLVNFLRPDRTECGWQIVSDQKIAENSVCDSVRIKYIPNRLRGPLHLSCREQSYFRHASDLFTRFHLYHRSASDGYFLLRRPEGFLITATKTYKDRFDPDRIAWVRAYQRQTNTLDYQGAHLPSSDAVEAAVVLQQVPDLGALLHFHASDRWTRNPAFAHLRLVPELPYGEPELGERLAEAIGARHSDGFLIMAEHGEVFWARQPQAEARIFAVLSEQIGQRHPWPWLTGLEGARSD